MDELLDKTTESLLENLEKGPLPEPETCIHTRYSSRHFFTEGLQPGETLLDFFGNDNFGLATWSDGQIRKCRVWLSSDQMKITRSTEVVEAEATIKQSRTPDTLWTGWVLLALRNTLSG